MPHGSDVYPSLNALGKVLSGTAASRWRRFRSRFLLRSRCQNLGSTRKACTQPNRRQTDESSVTNLHRLGISDRESFSRSCFMRTLL